AAAVFASRPRSAMTRISSPSGASMRAGTYHERISGSHAESIAELTEHLRTVAAERASVHERERSGLRCGELLEDLARVALDCHGPGEGLSHRFRRADDVAFRERRHLVTSARQNVAAEQRARRRLEQVAALPVVGEIRRVEPDDALVAAERELPAVR